MLTTSEHLTNLLQAPRIDPVLLNVANLYIAGSDIIEISQQLGIPRDRVVQVLDNESVKKYIEVTYSNQGYLNKFKRLELINKVIEAKVEAALDDPNKLSKKDLLDWIEQLRKIEEGMSPKKSAPTVAVQVNNYNDLLKDLIQQ